MISARNTPPLSFLGIILGLVGYGNAEAGISGVDWSLSRRKEYGEGGTAADFALNFDVPSLGFHEVFGDGEPKPGSA
jgi:hypothetical protein